MKCSKCGAQLPDDSTFCVECGNRVEAMAGSNGSFFSNAGDLGGSKPASAPSVWDTYQKEAPVKAQAPVVPPVQPQQPRPAAKPASRCPRCGSVLEPNAVFCVNCGLNLKNGAAPAAAPQAAPTTAEKTAARSASAAPRAAAPTRSRTAAAKPALSSKTLIIGIAAGVAALVLIVVLIGAMTNWFGLTGPGAQMLGAVEKTLKNGNFTVEFTMSDDYNSYDGVAYMDINVKERTVTAYMELDVDGEDGVIAIYDGYAIASSDGYTQSMDISDELDDIFDAYEAASSGNQEEITDLLEDMGMDMDDMEDYMDVKQLEKSCKKLVNNFNSKSWLKENAGYSTSKVSGVTVHTLEPDMADLLVAILEVLEPAFLDEDDYEDAMDSMDYVDSPDILVEIGVKSGYLATFNLEYEDDYDELQIEAVFTNIGKTKIDVAELEELLEDSE